MITYNSDLKIFYSTKINDTGILSGFGTRYLGNGRQANTIFDFFYKNKVEYKKVVVLGQIHSTNIETFVFKPGANIETIEDTDGVITRDSEVILTVRTADCLPIIFVDKEKGVIGISHQGWRGSLKKMAEKMADKMIDQGARKEKLLIAIGPGIGSCCYHIDDDRYWQFVEQFDGYSSQIFRTQAGRKYVDLAKLNFLILVSAGIKKENIDYFPFCTSCDKKRFFSFRRDRNSQYGEMFHFIVKTDKPKLFADL